MRCSIAAARRRKDSTAYGSRVSRLKAYLLLAYYVILTAALNASTYARQEAGGLVGYVLYCPVHYA
ncbi:hypothetical protein EAF00_011642 [Botryotinia globosa]|nr:hypothetical protein EAF00_011642 [Botryotinia globosa]